MEKLDEIFNNIEPEEVETERVIKEHDHYIYLMHGWNHTVDELRVFCHKVRRTMMMFPEIDCFMTDSFSDMKVRPRVTGDARYFNVQSNESDRTIPICTFSFIKATTRSVIRLYEKLREICVDIEDSGHYMFLDGQTMRDKTGKEFIYTEAYDCQRIVAFLDDYGKYASTPEDFIKNKMISEQMKDIMVRQSINRAFEAEIEAGNLEAGLIDSILKYSYSNDNIEFREIENMRWFANKRFPCSGDIPSEVWDSLPHRFIKTAYVKADIDKMRYPEKIEYMVPELSYEWNKHCNGEIQDTRVYRDSIGNIIILYSLVFGRYSDDFTVRTYLITKIYASHKKFRYEYAHDYFKLLLNNGNIFDNVLKDG